MKVWQYIALGVFAAFAWYELRPAASTTQLAVPQNPLGIAEAPPSASVSNGSSVLTGTQQGNGLFGNPSGLGTTLEALKNTSAGVDWYTEHGMKVQ